MTDKPPQLCPHCGKSLEQQQEKTPAQEESREYDHRGVLMPRRTRIGGIIIPQ